MATKHILPQGDSWIRVIPNIDERIKMTEAEYQEIWNLRPQNRPKGKMFGNEITFPRWHATYGQTYKFNGMDEEAQDISTHPYFIKIMKPRSEELPATGHFSGPSRAQRPSK